MRRKVLAVVGPTAVGKTDFSLWLATKYDGEIISADSMQVYRGMDIGTAKPSLAERARVPHHLLDVLEPQDPFSAADYQVLARAKVEEIAERGKLPVFSGGTGMYIRAAIDDYHFVHLPTNWEIRDQLRRRMVQEGLDQLYGELKNVDPTVANRVHPRDERRIVRALEVFVATGHPLSYWEQQRDVTQSVYDVLVIGLSRPRVELYRRIEQRVDQMFELGLVAEVETLLQRGLGIFASQALGYKELVPYLSGKATLHDTKEIIKRETRRYAKRQLSWFRGDARVRWIDLTDEQAAKAEATQLIEEFTSGNFRETQWLGGEQQCTP